MLPGQLITGGGSDAVIVVVAELLFDCGSFDAEATVAVFKIDAPF